MLNAQVYLFLSFFEAGNIKPGLNVVIVLLDKHDINSVHFTLAVYAITDGKCCHSDIITDITLTNYDS